MKKYLSAFVLGAFLIFTQSYALDEPQQPADYHAFIERARDAVVLIAAQGETSGFGSGFVVSADGIVVTNYHVIHRAEKIMAWFYDEEDPKYYVADVIGIDPAADLAVLRLNVKDEMLPLVHLQIEDEKEKIRVGDNVIAIGHLLGLDWTVTTGGVSHVNRPGNVMPYVKMVQHTAPINRGNSGGPLINYDGHVIGMNTAVRMMNNQTVGVAYALRGDIMYVSVIKIISGQEVIRAGLGVKLRQLSEFSYKKLSEMAPDTIIPNTFGAFVVEMTEDSWAYNQGLRNFDSIVAIDGIPINGASDAVDMLSKKQVGDVVTLIVIRDGVFTLVEYELKPMEFDYMAHFDKRMKAAQEKQQQPSE